MVACWERAEVPLGLLGAHGRKAEGEEKPVLNGFLPKAQGSTQDIFLLHFPPKKAFSTG